MSLPLKVCPSPRKKGAPHPPVLWGNLSQGRNTVLSKVFNDMMPHTRQAAVTDKPVQVVVPLFWFSLLQPPSAANYNYIKMMQNITAWCRTIASTTKASNGTSGVIYTATTLPPSDQALRINPNTLHGSRVQAHRQPHAPWHKVDKGPCTICLMLVLVPSIRVAHYSALFTEHPLSALGTTGDLRKPLHDMN